MSCPGTKPSFLKRLAGAALAVLLTMRCAAEERPRIIIGVNRPALVSLPEKQWKATIDKLSAAGVRYLRTTADPPYERVPAMVRYANDHGIETVLIIPVWAQDFYPPGVQPRPGNHRLFASRPLAQLDIARFSAFWSEHRKRIREAGARVFAYQIGNEINGAGFNGDYPISHDAHLLSLPPCDAEAICADVTAGLRTYSEILRAVRESGDLGDSLLIAAGMAYTTNRFVREVGGYFISAADAVQELDRLGAGQYIDAYAIHVYPWAPDIGRQAEHDGIQKWMDLAAQECMPPGNGGKPCWITEWGIRRTPGSECGFDFKRNRRSLDGLEYIQRSAHKRRLAAAFYFTWDAHPNFAIENCGELTIDPALITEPRP
ncbi:MAG TPA: hypothetical protein VFG05_06265 [Methylocella sp.]|nr:hypothetical protein [Methylocella sp.]